MRVAVYGGSFNPPHVGHAMVIAWLLWTDQVDQVWIVPVGSHAFGKALAPFPRRVAWCRALAGSISPNVVVHDIEAELPAPNYTLNTLEALAARHPHTSLRLVIGSDTLPDLPRWHRWDAIETQFRPLLVARAGFADVEGSPTFPEVSSTDVRDRFVRGSSVTSLVPRVVLDEITPPDVALWSGASS